MIPARKLLFLCLLTPIVLHAESKNPADYPLRVHILGKDQTTFYRNRYAEEAKGEGRANIFENGEARGADFSFECTGRPDNVAKSVAAVRPGVDGKHSGGTAVMVGAVRTPFSLPGMELINGQKTLVGSRGGACLPDRDFPVFLHWYQTGRLDLAALVTNRYSLDGLANGMTDLLEGKVAGRAVLLL